MIHKSNLMKIIKPFFRLFIFALLSPVFLNAQSGEVFTLTDEALKGDFAVQLSKLQWKYRAGDDSAWAARDFDDADWETIDGTILKPELLSRADWNGRAWFRLRFKIEEKLIGQNIVLAGTQRGATEVFLDGEPLVKFGEITDGGVAEYNPNHLPIPFRLDGGEEHSLAVRFASSTFREPSGWQATWLTSGGIFPGIAPTFLDGSDLSVSIGGYAVYASMRAGFLFIGILLALALLHLLLYLFYRVESNNLFYSLYAASFAFFLLFNNFRTFGHLGVMPTVIAGFIASLLLAASFIGLLAFVHVAFGRRLGIVFWTMTALWAASAILNFIFLNRFGKLQILPSVLIGLSFTFSIYQLVVALREKRNGAWILFGGLQVLAVAMFISLLRELRILVLPQDFYFFSDLGSLLAVPVAVSIFLARNFARTNRDLKAQLIQVEQLSLEKIEQQRHAAELHAENERRTKELEEARQLQLSMLPRQLPQIPNLEIAAYMKPATEVGGDYYDFHVGADGTLTFAVGDATGHGLRAGSVVTATKSLFNAFADDENIPQIFKQTSRALKKMNLRGLYMAMAMVKIKGGSLTICAAGMPSALIYRAASKRVEEVVIRAMPLGSVSNFAYQQQTLNLAAGDCIVLMSDGFPEMFNEAGEMLADDTASKLLRETADKSPQEIINRFVEVGERWAGTRPPDDDVTFVVIKIK
jgi:serine phosphatase RsbU (regulator of sigma subunit)